MTPRLIELARRPTILNTSIAFHEQGILAMAARLVELARRSTVGDAADAFDEERVFAVTARFVELAWRAAGCQAAVPVRCWRGGDGGGDCCGG